MDNRWNEIGGSSDAPCGSARGQPVSSFRSAEGQLIIPPPALGQLATWTPARRSARDLDQLGGQRQRERLLLARVGRRRRHGGLQRVGGLLPGLDHTAGVGRGGTGDGAADREGGDRRDCRGALAISFSPVGGARWVRHQVWRTSITTQRAQDTRSRTLAALLSHRMDRYLRTLGLQVRRLVTRKGPRFAKNLGPHQA